ncbi:hypothetical protein TRICI_001773 [Trichomonascus ciferrii]|uniref:Cep57 centrosome microtubule-binding domain-containing protein n=1 Tax=Trichomonascus ciferrii TaxID=44093 RepID=A0A642V7Q7_9ASCO|nr:hypothetical protein TRICI_001773 [Trichomonascus ciferrii]
MYGERVPPSSLSPRPQAHSTLDLDMSDFDISDTNFDLPVNENGHLDEDMSSAFEVSNYSFNKNNNKTTPSRNNNDFLSPQVPSAEVKRHFNNFSYANDYQISDNSIEYARGKARNLSANYSRRSSASSAGRGSPVAHKVTEQVRKPTPNKRQSPPKKSSSEDDGKYNFAIPTEYKDDASFFKFMNGRDKNRDSDEKQSSNNNNNNNLPDITGLSSIFSSETGSKRNRESRHKTIASVPVDPDDQALFTAFNSFQRKVDKLESDKHSLMDKIKYQEAELNSLRTKYNDEMGRYDDMEKRARKYKTMAASLKEQKLQSDNNDSAQAGYWKNQHDVLKEKLHDMTQQRNNAFGTISEKDRQIEYLENQVQNLKAEITRLHNERLENSILANNTAPHSTTAVTFTDPPNNNPPSTTTSSTSTEPKPAASTATATAAPTPATESKASKDTADSNEEIKQLLLKLLAKTDNVKEREEDKRVPEENQKEETEMEEQEDEKSSESGQGEPLGPEDSVIEALQHAIDRLRVRGSEKPAEKPVKKKQTSKPAKTKKDTTKKHRSRHYYESDNSEESTSEEEEVSSDADETSSSITDPGIALPTKAGKHREWAEPKQKSKRSSAKTYDSEKTLRNTPAPTTGKVPRLVDRVYESIPQECDVCNPTTTANSGYTRETFGVNKKSPEWDEESTLRPSMSPEDSVKLVLEKMSSELSALKDQYNGLMAEYNERNPASHRTKRREVAAGLKELVDEMESKADQIYAMYDVIAATKIPIEDDEVDDGPYDNDQPMNLLGRHEWIHT